MSSGNIKIIEVRSELGAGTRGASLGVDAIQMVALRQNDDFFSRYETVTIPTENKELNVAVNTPYARRINGIIKMYERVAEAISGKASGQEFTIVMAGDHSTAGGTVSGLRKAYPDANIAVIWIDAHADIHSPYTTPSGNLHGMPVAAMLGIDNKENGKNKVTEAGQKAWERLKHVAGDACKIDPEDIVYVAVRDFEEEEAGLMKQFNLRNYTVDEVRKNGATAVAKEILQRFANYDVLYVSFDVDSMDTSISRGTGTPVDNGLMLDEVNTLIQLLLASPKTRCFEIVEVNPLLDEKNKMAEVAFEIIKLAAQTVSNRAETNETTGAKHTG
jgi:arginase